MARLPALDPAPADDVVALRRWVPADVAQPARVLGSAGPPFVFGAGTKHGPVEGVLFSRAAA